MSHMRKLASASVVSMALGALVVAGTGSAIADPPDGTYRTYAAVGSDTTQSVWNGLTLGNRPIAQIASYDAVGSDTIQTKANGATFTRPVGSGNGVKALSAVWDPAGPDTFMGTALTNDEVDFARSSGGPTSGSGLTYLPFARDAVSVALKPFDSGTAIVSISASQLTAIYGGPDDNTAGTGVTYDRNTTLPIFRGHVLHPLLPQAASGTRKFFLGAINLSDVNDVAPYVDANSTTVENDGTALTSDGDLIPFSAAQWIAQVNGKQTDTTSGDKLLNLGGKTPFAGKAPNLAAGTLFGVKNSDGTYSTPPATGVGVFARDTYNVVPTAFLTGTAAQKALVTKLTGAGNGALGSTPAKAVIKKFGFGVLSYLGDSSFYLSGAYQH